VALTEGTWVFCQGTQKADHLARLGRSHRPLRSAAKAAFFPLPAGVDPLDAALSKLGANRLSGSPCGRHPSA